jgi:hypothetical protein
MAGLAETFNLDRTRELLKLRSMLNAAKFEEATRLAAFLEPERGFQVLTAGYATVWGKDFATEKKKWFSSSKKIAPVRLFFNLTSTKDTLNDVTIFRMDGFADEKDVHRLPRTPLHSLRLSSKHKIVSKHDAEGREILNIVPKGEPGAGKEETVELAFRQRSDAKRWRQALEQAVMAIHVTIVLHDLDWIRTSKLSSSVFDDQKKYNSFHNLAFARRIELDDIVLHAVHGDEYTSLLRDVTAHDYFLRHVQQK